MSMTARYLRVAPQMVAKIHRDPRILPEVLFRFGDEYGSKAMELDWTWHVIHFLLNGDVWEGEDPFFNAVLGGNQLAPKDLGYEPARALNAEEVAATAEALAGVSPETLWSRFDEVEIRRAKLYWEAEPDSKRNMLGRYASLRQFFREAAWQETLRFSGSCKMSSAAQRGVEPNGPPAPALTPGSSGRQGAKNGERSRDKYALHAGELPRGGRGRDIGLTQSSRSAIRPRQPAMALWAADQVTDEAELLNDVHLERARADASLEQEWRSHIALDRSPPYLQMHRVDSGSIRRAGRPIAHGRAALRLQVACLPVPCDGLTGPEEGQGDARVRWRNAVQYGTMRPVEVALPYGLPARLCLHRATIDPGVAGFAGYRHD